MIIRPGIRDMDLFDKSAGFASKFCRLCKFNHTENFDKTSTKSNQFGVFLYK